MNDTMRKHTGVKYAAIIAICVVLDVLLHVATSAYSTMPEAPNYTRVAQLLGPEITATLWALLAFSGVAYVFYRFQHAMPGSGVSKGLRYGSAIAVLWLFAMMEGVSLFGNSIIREFVVGLSDAIPVLAMGALLGLFVVTEKATTQSVAYTRPQKLLTILVFSTVFVLGRYAAYFTGVVQSGYQSSPVYTLLWTLLMGACIGVACVLLGQAARTSSLASSAIRFGICVFGVNWLVFLVFMPILFKGFLIDFLLRASIDILLVILGYYLLMLAGLYSDRRSRVQVI